MVSGVTGSCTPGRPGVHAHRGSKRLAISIKDKLDTYNNSGVLPAAREAQHARGRHRRPFALDLAERGVRNLGG